MRLLTMICVLAFTVPSLAQETDFSQLNGSQMVDDADQRLVRMDEVVDRIAELRQETGEDDDLRRLRCLNDKMAGVNGYQQLSAEARINLERVLSRRDRQAAEHQYSLVVIGSQRVENLYAEAERCAGDILTFAGETEGSTSVDDNIPQGRDLTATTEATDDLFRFVPDEPLPESTPFQ